jgi:gliding motility-associated lipoprotein GldH
VKEREGTDNFIREMKGSKNKLLAAALLLAVTAVACNRSVRYSENYSLEDGKWSMYEPAKYSCAIDDTVKTYNIALSLRTSPEYPYRNIYLFILTTFPSGTVITDTLQAMVTDEKGEWLGRGAGEIRELSIPYKSNVYFPESGEYHFRVIHGMRDTILNGVYDMGMKISLMEGNKK